jgi:hypothetical protein
MKVLEINKLLEVYSKGKIVAFLFLKETNEKTIQYLADKLGVQSHTLIGEIFEKEFLTVEEANDFVMNFREQKDLDLFYVCAWNNGVFLNENT